MKPIPLRQKISDFIELNWPVSTKEIAVGIGFEPDNGSIKKVSYHIKKLEKEEQVMTKRIGLALVVWPHEIERLRTIHELLKV